MPRTRSSKKKDGASQYEVAPEPASELSSDERGYAEVLEAEVVDFIDDYWNDEYEEKFESPQSNKRISGIVRADKGGDFNESLENNWETPI